MVKVTECQEVTNFNRWTEQVAIVPRMCLGGCECYMRSTGPAHRICNKCKGPDYRFVPYDKGGQQMKPLRSKR